MTEFDIEKVKKGLLGVGENGQSLQALEWAWKSLKLQLSDLNKSLSAQQMFELLETISLSIQSFDDSTVEKRVFVLAENTDILMRLLSYCDQKEEKIIAVSIKKALDSLVEYGWLSDQVISAGIVKRLYSLVSIDEDSNDDQNHLATQFFDDVLYKNRIQVYAIQVLLDSVTKDNLKLYLYSLSQNKKKALKKIVSAFDYKKSITSEKIVLLWLKHQLHVVDDSLKRSILDGLVLKGKQAFNEDYEYIEMLIEILTQKELGQIATVGATYNVNSGRYKQSFLHELLVQKNVVVAPPFSIDARTVPIRAGESLEQLLVNPEVLQILKKLIMLQQSSVDTQNIEKIVFSMLIDDEKQRLLFSLPVSSTTKTDSEQFDSTRKIKIISYPQQSLPLPSPEINKRESGSVDQKWSDIFGSSNHSDDANHQLIFHFSPDTSELIIGAYTPTEAVVHQQILSDFKKLLNSFYKTDKNGNQKAITIKEFWKKAGVLAENLSKLGVKTSFYKYSLDNENQEMRLAGLYTSSTLHQ